jgi:hypothetical protein
VGWLTAEPSLEGVTALIAKLFWDLTGRTQRPRHVVPLSAKELDDLWKELAAEDAAQAYRAMQTFGLPPEQAVPYFKKHLAPVGIADAKQTAQLIKDLDSEEFAVREKAMDDLEKLGEDAETTLRQALKGDLSEEAPARVQKIVDRLSSNSSLSRREPRAIEVLEHMGTPEAREVLRALARGAAGAWKTEEPQASLDRLARQASGKLR